MLIEIATNLPSLQALVYSAYNALIEGGVVAVSDKQPATTLNYLYNDNPNRSCVVLINDDQSYLVLFNVTAAVSVLSRQLGEAKTREVLSSMSVDQLSQFSRLLVRGRFQRRTRTNGHATILIDEATGSFRALSECQTVIPSPGLSARAGSQVITYK
jgi:hypothetical protein